MKTIWTPVLVALALPLAALSAKTEESPAFDILKYGTLPKDVIESRLKDYAGNNQQREATLERLFQQAGCGADQLSEQPVKGSKQPNVVGRLPRVSGSTVCQPICVGPSRA